MLGRGLRGGGPGRPPCWRTLKESRKGLGSVSLKINNQHTQLTLRSATSQSLAADSCCQELPTYP